MTHFMVRDPNFLSKFSVFFPEWHPLFRNSTKIAEIAVCPTVTTFSYNRKKFLNQTSNNQRANSW
jgi:hypothetical protein